MVGTGWRLTMHPVQTYLRIVLHEKCDDGTTTEQAFAINNIGDVLTDERGTIVAVGSEGVPDGEGARFVESPAEIANLINNALKGWG